MAIIGTLPSIIQNGQLVDAAPVMADFNYIVNQVNANALPVGFTPAGVLLSVGIFQGNATYTPNPLATKAIVEAVGGGGGGAGTGATAAGQVSTGGGGAAGSYGRIIILSGLTTQTVTIGIGGAGGLATQVGGNGTATSFGALMVCPGGAGGQATTPATPPFISNPSSPGTLPSGTGSFLVAGTGRTGYARHCDAGGQRQRRRRRRFVLRRRRGGAQQHGRRPRRDFAGRGRRRRVEHAVAGQRDGWRGG